MSVRQGIRRIVLRSFAVSLGTVIFFPVMACGQTPVPDLSALKAAAEFPEEHLFEGITTIAKLEDAIAAAEKKVATALAALKTANANFEVKPSDGTTRRALFDAIDAYNAARTDAEKLHSQLKPPAASQAPAVKASSDGTQVRCRPTLSANSFPFRPLILAIPEPTSPEQFANARINFLNAASTRLPALPSVVCDYRFSAPAEFPLPQFGLAGQRLDAEGLVIYEGMQFLYHADGHYQVQFTARTPEMPVTLKMMLVLGNEQRCVAYTLNLPVINITRRADLAAGQDIERTIQLEGYLPALQAESQLTVLSRQGSARFGFALAQK